MQTTPKEPQARPLTWGDLQISKRSWQKRGGEWRVHVSLKYIAFVCHTFWIKDWNPGEIAPQAKAAILLTLQRELNRKLKTLEQYLI